MELKSRSKLENDRGGGSVSPSPEFVLEFRFVNSGVNLKGKSCPKWGSMKMLGS